MSYPVLYPEENDLLPIEFDSFDGGTGASITMTGLAVTDIEIFKDGGATTRSSDNGYALLDTDGIDIASITGFHGFSIDLSDNSDAGFFVVGSWYTVVIASVTIDGQTVNFIAGKFRILSLTRGMAGTALPDAVADAAGGMVISDAGGLDIDAMNDAAVRLTAVRAAVLTDWIDAGRLDVLLDAIPTTAMRGTDNGATAAQQDTINTVVDGLQTDLDNATDGLGALKTLIDTVNTDLSNGTDGLGALKALIDALNDLSAAQILTEVNTALDTAISELGVAAPTATPSIRTGIILGYMLIRNKLVVQTSATDALEVYNDAGTLIAKKLLTDDGSDYTEAEMVSG